MHGRRNGFLAYDRLQHFALSWRLFLMRRILIAAGLLLGLSMPAWAVCPTPLTAKDASGTTQNLSTTVDGAGSCLANVVIEDKGGTNQATVKAASTAPAATDTAIVVSLSPNSAGLSVSATNSVAINISTATTTQLVALVSGKAIYVTGWDVISGGTGNITLEYGTGTACATGTQVLTGAYNLAAQAGISKGSGVGAMLFVPAGDALCAVTSAAVQMSGSLSYTQF
jgi:hypothetical protein